MNLRIIKAGILDTVQDMGRYGWQHLGVNPGGAMDKLSARIANMLVGNNPQQAVIEIHFPASAFFFEQPALIAISGADFSATVNGDPVPSLHPILVSKYSILQFHGIVTGTRAYLAVQGGFAISEWLGSHTTHVRANAGGFKGRALQTDDEIVLGATDDWTEIIGKKEYIVLPWKADVDWNTGERQEIFILPGPEHKRLALASQSGVVESDFVITNQSDRMGYQLKGEPLSLSSDEEITSSGVNFGTIQLLPTGQLIILMADHQTTGGYPRIAHVISADHSKLAQMKPGDSLRFTFTDLRTAENLLLKQQQHLQQLQNACTFRLTEFTKH